MPRKLMRHYTSKLRTWISLRTKFALVNRDIRKIYRGMPATLLVNFSAAHQSSICLFQSMTGHTKNPILTTEGMPVFDGRIYRANSRYDYVFVMALFIAFFLAFISSIRCDPQERNLFRIFITKIADFDEAVGAFDEFSKVSEKQRETFFENSYSRMCELFGMDEDPVAMMQFSLSAEEYLIKFFTRK
jgi:hypothetical protein